MFRGTYEYYCDIKSLRSFISTFLSTVILLHFVLFRDLFKLYRKHRDTPSPSTANLFHALPQHYIFYLIWKNNINQHESY